MNMTAYLPHLLTNALPIAAKAFEKLNPFCSRIDVAGSVRRRMEVVKDIEIVCIPNNREIWTTGNLFSQPAANGHPAANFHMAANSLGKVMKGNTSGRYMQIELPEGLNLDLFMTTEEDYFRQLAIRTGPADFSHKVIAGTWSKKGWCGTSFGLRRKNECTMEDGKWKLAIPNIISEKPPVWQSEEEFFKWLGLSYTKPQLR